MRDRWHATDGDRYDISKQIAFYFVSMREQFKYSRSVRLFFGFCIFQALCCAPFAGSCQRQSYICVGRVRAAFVCVPCKKKTKRR